MTNPASRFFHDAVWQEAFEMYEKDCHGKLWEAPQWVQDEYKERARKALSEYLATCGIV
jgi:hypothetical protein